MGNAGIATCAEEDQIAEAQVGRLVDANSNIGLCYRRAWQDGASRFVVHHAGESRAVNSATAITAKAVSGSQPIQNEVYHLMLLDACVGIVGATIVDKV